MQRGRLSESTGVPCTDAVAGTHAAPSSFGISSDEACVPNDDHFFIRDVR